MGGNPDVFRSHFWVVPALARPHNQFHGGEQSERLREYPSFTTSLQQRRKSEGSPLPFDLGLLAIHTWPRFFKPRLVRFLYRPLEGVSRFTTIRLPGRFANAANSKGAGPFGHIVRRSS